MDSNIAPKPASSLSLPPQTQQLPSPCESSKPADDFPANIGSRDMQNDKLESNQDSNSTTEDHDPSDLLFHLIAPAQEAPAMEPSLFVEDNENDMEDTQVAENKNEEATNDDKEDCHAINDKRILEDGYAMEVDNTTEEDGQTQSLLEADTDNEEDTLPSVDNIVDQELANLHLQRSQGDEGDDIDVAEEDDDSDYEDDSSVSSDNDCEHEAPQPNSTSASAKKDKKPRQKSASTAREYVARLREKEDQKLARRRKQEEGKRPGAKCSRKRKLAESDLGPSKAIKTANGNSYLLVGGFSSSSTDIPLLPAESIKASTHADQMAQLKASIPQDCDTRRKNTQKQDLKEAIKVFGCRRIEAVDGDWRLKGMKTAMRCHQITAVAWMVKRELARMEPFGGILADAMGMGKTVMSLACILGNPPDDEHIERFCRATLVVVPSKTVALQWEAEARVRILRLKCK